MVENGYKQWNEFDVYYKSFGDTAVFFSVNSDRIRSKSIFIPVPPSDSTLSLFLKSKGYIELTSTTNIDSKFAYNEVKGRIYRIERNEKKISLTQYGQCFAFGVDL
ncbi:MAG: hypothetical protein BroJett042_04870 [Bacteroidota bacterium]|nr:MAG: hypothetical protein BroJett042_04870 [Bacteroidota bacterium]